MKKIFLTAMMVGAASLVQAQDTYLNDRLTNGTGDVYGTARYVGMGGAMGALGNDISTMGWNPAGIGLMYRSDLSFTAGALWNNRGIEEENNAHATLDQLGAVYTIGIETGSRLNYLNIGFNYQKKKNYNGAFYADHNALGGLSQMYQLAEMANAGFDTDYNLTGWAVDNQYLTKNPDGSYSNSYAGEINRYTTRSWGSQNAYDFNISGNVLDRVFWGFTLGFENIRYRSWSDYYEESTNNSTQVYGDYSLYNDQAIDGFGFNMKAGVIVRPFEDRPFRVALAAESPTWYNLKSSTYYQLTDQVDKVQSKMAESYLEYSIRSPFKVRLGIGSTVGELLAWDIDYEYANSAATKMGYPRDAVDDPNNSLFNNTWDKSMNAHTQDRMGGSHNLRAGLEVKPTKAMALRIGYNFATSPYKSNASFDQYALNSYAMDYATSTSYMTLSNVNCLTLGLGFTGRRVYFDVAYKLRNQKADFYAFYLPSNGEIDHSPNALTPVKDVDLTKHQITATLGFNF